MDPLTPKAVWGFNGTERPGAVYLAAVLAAHTQKGLPAFGIYGRDVQDATDGTIPDDVQAKILRFAKAGLAAAILRGKSYLSLGGVSMGIAGSIVDQPFFEKYLGMRVEAVDMSEIYRRLEEGIYDPVEFEQGLAWTRANCPRAWTSPTPPRSRSPARSSTRTGRPSSRCSSSPATSWWATRASPSWATARRRWAATPSSAASRASATGPTTAPTATSWRRC